MYPFSVKQRSHIIPTDAQAGQSLIDSCSKVIVHSFYINRYNMFCMLVFGISELNMCLKSYRYNLSEKILSL